jgi:type I restriction-modification system DNA methylase subunit
MQFDQAYLPINTPDAVPYKNYMTNYAEAGIETMSLPKFICSFILNEVITPLENKYKDKQIDISSILYNEFLRYTKSDGKDCGVVLTPSHIARLMCYLIINDPQDIVIDLCTGSAAFLVEALNRKKSLCQTQIDEEKLKEGYIGVELLQHMYFLAFANLVFNGISTDHLIFSDCYKDKVANNLKNIQPTAGILNPPYAMMKGTKDKKMHEWSFVLESIKYLPKGAKMAAIVPMSCGLNDNKIVSELRAEILKNNRLDMIIKVADDLFQPNAAINTSIFLFTVGETATTNHQVFCVDYSNDGFYVSDNKRKPTENVQKLYDEIIDIIDNRKVTDKSNFRQLGTDDWCYLPKDDIGEDLNNHFKNIVNSQIGSII